VTTRGSTLAALLAALGRPSWWILALAGFLVRGGIILFVFAIVSLPSPLALSNVFGPIVTQLYFGGLEPSTVALIVTSAVVVVSWVVAGSWLAAAMEVALIREAEQAAADEGLPVRPMRPMRSAGRLLISRSAAAHLVALVALAVTIAIGSVQIYAVTYRELVNPSDTGPIVFRVIQGAAVPLAAIAIVWILCEIVGGMAVRRIVLDRASVLGAVLRSAFDLVRRPAGGLLAPVVTTAILLVDLGAVLAMVLIVWTQVRDRLVHGSDEPLPTGLALVTLGAAWCLALLVTGLIDAWRSAAMTFEAERIAATAEAWSTVAGESGSQTGPPGGGTFGASAHRLPGDWSADDPGGSL
jgi:hypothetical protein